MSIKRLSLLSLSLKASCLPIPPPIALTGRPLRRMPRRQITPSMLCRVVHRHSFHPARGIGSEFPTCGSRALAGFCRQRLGKKPDLLLHDMLLSNMILSF